MRGLFGLLYVFLFLGLVTMSFFILFHLTRYSIHRRVASLAAVIFVTVTAVLLATNALLFFQLPLDAPFLSPLTIPSPR